MIFIARVEWKPLRREIGKRSRSVLLTCKILIPAARSSNKFPLRITYGVKGVRYLVSPR